MRLSVFMPASGPSLTSREPAWHKGDQKGEEVNSPKENTQLGDDGSQQIIALAVTF